MVFIGGLSLVGVHISSFVLSMLCIHKVHYTRFRALREFDDVPEFKAPAYVFE